MTTNTKKILVALLLCFVLLVTVFLGVFCFIPNFSVNEYGNYYQSPLTVIQKSSAFTNSVKAQYSVKLDENVEDASIDGVIKAIKTRLVKAYGYYGSVVEYDEESGLINIQIPESNNSNTEVQYSAQTILNNVVVTGKVEILNASYPGTYSESSVLLTQEHFKRASIQSYVNQDATMYVCKVSLTREGKKLAEALTTGTAYICALDGSSETWVYYTGSSLQIYYAYQEESQSLAKARAMAGFISSGTLDATLTSEGSVENIENNLGWIFLAVFGAIVLASFVFFAVRYKKLSIVPILMQALAIVIFMIFGALVHLEIFNIAMAVGVILAYAFMSFFTAFAFEKVCKATKDGKSYSWARHMKFNEAMIVNLIAHGALLVLGIILWVIPTVVTAPLGNAFVYGAILSFVVTFCLNRLFALIISPFCEDNSKKTKARK